MSPGATVHLTDVFVIDFSNNRDKQKLKLCFDAQSSGSNQSLVIFIKLLWNWLIQNITSLLNVE